MRTPFGIDYSLRDEQHANELKQTQMKKGEDGDDDSDDDEDQQEQHGAEESTALNGNNDASGNDSPASPSLSTSADDASASAASNTAAAISTTAVAPSPSSSSSSSSSPASSSGTPIASSSSSTTTDLNPASSSKSIVYSLYDFSDPPSDPPLDLSNSFPYPLTPIGDVNLFLHDDFNLSDYGIHGGGAELECMVALSSYRRRGLASESLKLAMQWAGEALGISRFVAKVLATNEPSLRLFRDRLGFDVVEYVECFDEIVLFKDTSDSRIRSEDIGEEQKEENSHVGETENEERGKESSSCHSTVTTLNTASTTSSRPRQSDLGSYVHHTIDDLD